MGGSCLLGPYITLAEGDASCFKRSLGHARSRSGAGRMAYFGGRVRAETEAPPRPPAPASLRLPLTASAIWLLQPARRNHLSAVISQLAGLPPRFED